ncbi:MAG: hypothetical protein HWE22_02400 [Flavobacteriales bacterium]|nr:hypothetical protein [Flavobacteriales bacterium]
MLQKIRNHFVTKWVAIGIIPSFLFPMTSFAEIHHAETIAPNTPTNYSAELMSSIKGAVPALDRNLEGVKSEIQQAVSGVGGPTDANYQGSAASSEFVDLATGDFSYSIPLMNVGGYPLTLSYDANVTMDQQASMVGLGWSLSTGAINRVVRGIPDDFNGDLITTTMNLRPQLTISNDFALNAEFVGVDMLGDKGDIGVDAGIKVGYSFNNYNGNESSIGGSGSFGIGKDLKGSGPKAFVNGGLNSSSKSGLSTNVALSIGLGKEGRYSSSLGLSRNSLYGSSLNTNFGYTASNSIGHLGLSLNGTFSLGMQSYTPTASFEFDNKSWTLDVAAGAELPFVITALHGAYSRTKSTVCLKENVKSQPAFGYMNQQNGYASNAIQDFNIHLGEVHEKVSSVNTPLPTNDYFIVSGAGMFRAIRNDAGYVKNPTTKSDGDATALGGDVGVGGPAFEVGVNINYSWNNTTSGNWLDNNPLSDASGAGPDFAFEENLPFGVGTAEENGKYENVLLQKVNNRGSSSNARYYGMNDEKPLRQTIGKEGGEIVGYGSMTSDNGAPLYLPSANEYYQVERRNQNEVLINESNRELKLSGKDDMTSYTLNNFSYENGDYLGTTVIDRSLDAAKFPDHHIGQLTLIGTGGFKQVYGIPVINETDQVSFNVSSINKDEGVTDPIVGSDGLVSFAPGVDNSLNNDRGDNNFYLKNHVPAHATSYLLTEQLSDNFVDLTGNGPTPDDYGSYTKINYAFNGETEWRFPFELGKAIYNEGFKSNPLDDMGSYVYGKRDDWLIHSIETKNFIAEFSYSDRDDAYGVNGENGSHLLTDPAQKLDEIRLYTRQGKERGEKPVKTAHFEYDYELCPGTPDNSTGGGKLTLKNVYFTGHDSPEGKLHKYKFDYAHNASYNPSQVDRWGNYQTGGSISHDALSTLDNNEYPYTNQNVAQANADAKKWKLTSIDLPTGSRIEIKYEADQYKYIQDAEATRMFRLEGFYASEESELATLTSGDFSDAIFDPDNKDQEYFYMLVNLEDNIYGTDLEAHAIFENDYLPTSYGNNRYLYFNALLNLAPHNDGIIDPDVYEYVQGYAKLVNEGWRLLESSPGIWDRVIYQVKPEDLDAGKPTKGVTSPVSRAAWRLIKEALPLVLYPEDDLQAIYAKDDLINCDGVDLEAGETEPDLSDDSKNHKKNMKSVRSIYHMMRNTGFGSRAVIDPNGDLDKSDTKCWVRMRPGNGVKIGGGHRVSEIRMFDNWNESVPSENGAEYGLLYDYTESDSEESSGVATYEPIASGGDEIALRRPKFFTHNQKKAPSEEFYTEFPLNEEVYATASVGYSNVRVRSISYSGLNAMVPGYTDHQFYTAKDYPVRISHTNIEQGTELRKPGLLGIAGISKRRFGLSYGVNIVTNDMHGKFKAKTVYSQNGSVIYSMRHMYHATDGELKNELPTILTDGSLDNKRIIGQHSDFLTFLNKSESNFSSVSLKAQADVTLPFQVVPSAYPGASTFENTIYTSLTTKITYQSGIIDTVFVEDNGRSKYTTNLLYDAMSGAAIVTEVIPEKGPGTRKMYDYNYPAYWKYKELGQDSENARVIRSNITGADAVIDAGEETYFNPGDRLSVFEVAPAPIVPGISTYVSDFWVIENEATEELYLADKDGVLFNPTAGTIYRFKVIDPGNKNATDVSMANVSSLIGPDLGISPYYDEYPHEKVINISGIELFEDAKLGGTCVNVGSQLNPYTRNIKGQWKLKHTYSFDGKRDYSADNSRVDGCLTEYQPFWQNQDGEWLAINDPTRTGYTAADPYQDWIQNGEATVYDEFGVGLESKNPLEVYSTAGIGYNHSYSTYNAVNARYQEVAFDGFEDYETNGVLDGTGTFVEFPCQERHLDGGTINVALNEAHTGKNSMAVTSSNEGHFYAEVWDGNPAVSMTHTIPFVLAPDEELDGFKLINDEDDNRYVLSVWVKEENPDLPTTFNAANVSIEIDGSSVIPLETNRSNIIDGWQRLEIIFEVDPLTVTGSLVDFHFLGFESNKIFYDDLRIHPFDSEMKSQVIDPVKQRITATHDSRNFATFYQYDENGTLVRISQETIDGIQTVKENRFGIVLND